VTLLAGTLALHAPRCQGRCVQGCIRDVERFAGAFLERKGIRLGDWEYEDTLAFLVSEAWAASEKYDPELDANENLAAWVYTSLSQRYVDKKRARYRTRWVSGNSVYERPPEPEFVGLDPAELERALPGRNLATAEHCSPDFSRVLRSRGGRDPRGRDEMGEH
jgi:DNA-directed RNA polymerase specialized sigma24 family protein